MFKLFQIFIHFGRGWLPLLTQASFMFSVAKWTRKLFKFTNKYILTVNKQHSSRIQYSQQSLGGLLREGLPEQAFSKSHYFTPFFHVCHGQASPSFPMTCDRTCCHGYGIQKLLKSQSSWNDCILKARLGRCQSVLEHRDLLGKGKCPLERKGSQIALLLTRQYLLRICGTQKWIR